MSRISKQDYFLEIALTVSARSTCLDKQVGCVLVNHSNIIIATGYNGAPRGMEHCLECAVALTGQKELCPAAHAEQNALLYAHADEIHKCYCTLEPCITCTRMLMNTSCSEVIFIQETNSVHSGRTLWRKMHESWSWNHATGWNRS